MKLLNRYFRYIGDSDVIKYILSKNIEIAWVIEAGCHDGRDTLLISNLLRPKKIIAFEPDSKARKIAAELFKQNQLKVDLYEFALSDLDSIRYLNFMDGIEGSGSTYIAKTGSTPVQVVALDSLNLKLDGFGLLWLDVEGYAVQALDGGLSTLRNLRFAKIEVQMHDMHLNRKADIFEVIEQMNSLSLLPIRAPLHPGFFGDVLFVHRCDLAIRERIWSSILKAQLLIVHKFLYPMLHKPVKL